MMYITMTDESSSTWHVGERLCVSPYLVMEVQADGDELNVIIHQGLFTLPSPSPAKTRRVWRFFGDQAKFIIGNLATR